MSPSGAELIRQIRSQIEEVDPSEVARASRQRASSIVDVRESEECDAGHIPGAKHVPRGYLESRIEGAVARSRRSASSSTAPPASAPRSPPTRCSELLATRTSPR